MRVQKSNILLGIWATGLLILTAACGKDKFTTRPQLKFVKASSYDVPRGGIMQFTLEFTDAEGDLTDSLYIERVVPQCNASTNRNLRYAIPAFPATKDAKGEIEVAFANGVFVPGYVALSSPACGRPDTTTFRFYIKDKEKNVSDTVEVDRPIIIRN